MYHFMTKTDPTLRKHSTFINSVHLSTLICNSSLLTSMKSQSKPFEKIVFRMNKFRMILKPFIKLTDLSLLILIPVSY